MTSARYRAASTVSEGNASLLARSQKKKEKKQYTTVFELVTQEKKKLLISSVNSLDPPRGYTFVQIGSTPGLVKRCLDRCRTQGLQVYSVFNEDKRRNQVSEQIRRVGYHIPSAILANACDFLGYVPDPANPGVYKHGRRELLFTSELAKRLEAHRGKEDHEQISLAIRELFPNIPEDSVQPIIDRAFEGGSKRVGRAKDLSLADRVGLAVGAHIRHVHTDYDTLLTVFDWEECRRIVADVVTKKLKQWRGELDDDDRATEQEDIFREYIVIDDDDDNDENNGSDGSDSIDSFIELRDIPPTYEKARSLQPGHEDRHRVATHRPVPTKSSGHEPVVSYRTTKLVPQQIIHEIPQAATREYQQSIQNFHPHAPGIPPQQYTLPHRIRQAQFNAEIPAPVTQSRYELIPVLNSRQPNRMAAFSDEDLRTQFLDRRHPPQSIASTVLRPLPPYPVQGFRSGEVPDDRIPSAAHPLYHRPQHSPKAVYNEPQMIPRKVIDVSHLPSARMDRSHKIDPSKPEDIPLPSVERPAAGGEQIASPRKLHTPLRREDTVTVPARLRDDRIPFDPHSVHHAEPVDANSVRPAPMTKRKSWPISRAPPATEDGPGMKRLRLDAVAEQGAVQPRLDRETHVNHIPAHHIRSPRRMTSDVIDLTSEVNPMRYSRNGAEGTHPLSPRGHLPESMILQRQQHTRDPMLSLGASPRAKPRTMPHPDGLFDAATNPARPPIPGKPSFDRPIVQTHRVSYAPNHHDQFAHGFSHYDSHHASDRVSANGHLLDSSGSATTFKPQPHGLQSTAPFSSPNRASDINTFSPSTSSKRHTFDGKLRQPQFADMPPGSSSQKLNYGLFDYLNRYLSTNTL